VGGKRRHGADSTGIRLKSYGNFVSNEEEGWECGMALGRANWDPVKSKVNQEIRTHKNKWERRTMRQNNLKIN